MANEVTVRSDGKWRQFVYRHDVPKSILESQFDWMKTDDGKWPEDEYFDGFFKYLNTWYHLANFTRLTEKSGPFAGWDAAEGDSYFSGTLIQLSPDGEEYRVGRYSH